LSWSSTCLPFGISCHDAIAAATYKHFCGWATSDRSTPTPLVIMHFELEDERNLARILRQASMEENKTREPNSTFDVFLEGFHAGEGTEKLLRHVVVVCLDDEAYSKCTKVHPHRCFLLRTPGVDFSGEKLFMVPDYLKMMWR
ncbi:unnamed protein product, partial [Thlaspi arvense]